LLIAICGKVAATVSLSNVKASGSRIHKSRTASIAGTPLLGTLDVRIEERVLILLPDIPEFAYSFFGAIKIGAVPVPVNTLLRAKEYEYLLNDTSPRIAITSESLMGIGDRRERNCPPRAQSTLPINSAY